MLTEVFYLHEKGSLADARLTYILDDSDSIAIEKRPMMLICPGGGYEHTSDREAEPLAMHFLSIGYHVAVLRYSVAPAVYPTALLEAAASMKLIHEHAKEWYVDTDKIVVQGSSAGGHLAACLAMFWHTKWLAEMAGVTNDILKPAAMLLNYPVITSGEYAHRGSFKQLLGGNETEEMLELLSLEKQVTEYTPPGQWVPNKYGDNKNLEAVEFFKHVNTLILGRNPGAVMIAEESTAWPKVTGRVEDDGLNFSYKWNMGWMHDFLDYMKLDPYFRKDNHHKMTFAMSYNESEKYILVLSHDEVVHLKCSMINKMPGEMEDKFKNLMVGYAFMMGHPGKKLLFMGQEFAQLQEWSEARELDWYLLENPDHKHMQNWVKKLLHIYQKNPALYELDSSWGGFEWINANDAERSIFSFIRKSKDGKNNLLFVCNFTPVERSDYRVGVPKHKTYKLILNSDDAEFGGSGKERPVNYKSVSQECDGRPYSFAYPLPGFGVAVFRY